MPYKDLEKQKIAKHQSYLRNKEGIKKRSKELRKNRRKITQEWYNLVMSTKKCSYCSENNPICLEWHHIDPNTKFKEVSMLFWSHYSKKRIIEEMVKCIVVCANCHRKVHAGVVEGEGFEPSQ